MPGLTEAISPLGNAALEKEGAKSWMQASL
jgi:hypothetical protein